MKVRHKYTRYGVCSEDKGIVPCALESTGGTLASSKSSAGLEREQDRPCLLEDSINFEQQTDLPGESGYSHEPISETCHAKADLGLQSNCETSDRMQNERGIFIKLEEGHELISLPSFARYNALGGSLSPLDFPDYFELCTMLSSVELDSTVVDSIKDNFDMVVPLYECYFVYRVNYPSSGEHVVSYRFFQEFNCRRSNIYSVGVRAVTLNTYMYRYITLMNSLNALLNHEGKGPDIPNTFCQKRIRDQLYQFCMGCKDAQHLGIDTVLREAHWMGLILYDIKFCHFLNKLKKKQREKCFAVLSTGLFRHLTEVFRGDFQMLTMDFKEVLREFNLVFYPFLAEVAYIEDGMIAEFSEALLALIELVLDAMHLRIFGDIIERMYLFLITLPDFSRTECKSMDVYDDCDEDLPVVLYRAHFLKLSFDCNSFIVISSLNGSHGEVTETDDLWEEILGDIFEMFLAVWFWVATMVHWYWMDFGYPIAIASVSILSIYTLLQFTFFIVSLIYVSVRPVCSVAIQAGRVVSPALLRVTSEISCQTRGVASLGFAWLRFIVWWATLTTFVIGSTSLVIFVGLFIYNFYLFLKPNILFAYLVPFFHLLQFEIAFLSGAYSTIYHYLGISCRMYLLILIFRWILYPFAIYFYATIFMTSMVTAMTQIAFVGELLRIQYITSTFREKVVFFGGMLLYMLYETFQNVDDGFLTGEVCSPFTSFLSVLYRIVIPKTEYMVPRSHPRGIRAGKFNSKRIRAVEGRYGTCQGIQTFAEREHGKISKSCPYAWRSGSFILSDCINTSCPYNHEGVNQDVCVNFLRNCCHARHCGWLHFKEPIEETERNDEVKESKVEEEVRHEVIFSFYYLRCQEESVYIDGTGREYNPPEGFSPPVIQDPFSSGRRTSKNPGFGKYYYVNDDSTYSDSFLEVTEIPSFQLGTVYYPKQEIVYVRPWLESLVREFGNIGFDLKNQNAVLTYLDKKTGGTSLDFLKTCTQLAFLYRQAIAYPGVKDNAPALPNLLRNVIQNKLNILSMSEVGLLPYVNTFDKELSYKFNGLFHLHSKKGFSFRLKNGKSFKGIDLCNIGDGVEIDKYPKFKTTTTTAKTRPFFCMFVGYKPWVYYARTGNTAVSALPRLLAARDDEEDYNEGQATVISLPYISTFGCMSDLLELCEGNLTVQRCDVESDSEELVDHHLDELYARFDGTQLPMGLPLRDTETSTYIVEYQNTNTKATIRSTEKVDGHVLIPLDWVQEFVLTLTSLPRLILCWLALSYYFISFLSGKYFEFFEICYTNIFGYLDTNTFLTAQAQLPTPKRALYTVWTEEFKVLWSLFFGNFVTQLKVKDEVAKHNGYPRLFGSLDGAVLAGRGVADLSKLLFSGFSLLPSIVIAGFRYEFCDCQERSASDTFFNRLFMNDRTSFYFYSDDSVFKFVIDGQVYVFETDISKCDMSNRLSIFYYTYIIIRSIFGKTVADNIVRQAHSMARLVNPSNKEEFVNLMPHFFFEYSGLIITTLLNNVASMFIAMSIFAYYSNTKFDGINVPPEKIVEALTNCIEQGAKNIGYKLSIKYCASPSDATFLKRISDGKVSTVCLGVLLRTFGTMEEYTPQVLGLTRSQFDSLTDSERFEVYGRQRIEGLKNEPGNFILDALRKRFMAAGAPDSFDNSVLKGRYPLVEDVDWYMLVEMIENLKVGDIVSCNATKEIFSVDYGVEDDE